MLGAYVTIHTDGVCLCVHTHVEWFPCARFCSEMDERNLMTASLYSSFREVKVCGRAVIWTQMFWYPVLSTLSTASVDLLICVDRIWWPQNLSGTNLHIQTPTMRGRRRGRNHRNATVPYDVELTRHLSPSQMLMTIRTESGTKMEALAWERLGF